MIAYTHLYTYGTGSKTMNDAIQRDHIHNEFRLPQGYIFILNAVKCVVSNNNYYVYSINIPCVLPIIFYR